MITLETLVWLAPILAVVVVLATGLFEVWLADYLERCKARRSAPTQP
jgi:hypothetical protein